jgi:hypothetical protein
MNPARTTGILSEVKDPSFFHSPREEEGFFAALRMTPLGEVVSGSALPSCAGD